MKRSSLGLLVIVIGMVTGSILACQEPCSAFPPPKDGHRYSGTDIRIVRYDGAEKDKSDEASRPDHLQDKKDLESYKAK